ncbi:MAG: TIGR00153 family protein [Planctomycetia bacterium]|nr:TIGR00153 family protein [Planctomycetia bacterium]
MRTIANLFGKSPFVPLQSHMRKVGECVDGLGDLFQVLVNEDYDSIGEIARKISKTEHEADLVKTDIRNHLPRGLFLPVDRGKLLEILSTQDEIADTAENVAVLCTLKNLPFPENMKDLFLEFCSKSTECFRDSRGVIEQLDELLESGFGGIAAEKVRELVHAVAVKEHEVDLCQRQLLRVVFGSEENLSYSEFHLWLKILSEIGTISDLSENLADKVRTTLEIK